MRIAVVEDVSELAWLADHYLRLAGHDVTPVEQITPEMLTVAWWDGIDCAVVDARLPGVDGTVLLAWLQEHVPSVRRVLCSASVEVEDARRHAHVTLLKPYSKADLLEAVE